jgi:transposase InsO family protein
VLVAFGKLIRDGRLIAPIEVFHEQKKRSDEAAYVALWRELIKRGIPVGKQRVQRLMQKHGIRARGKRRFRVVTTDSQHNLPVAPNL